MFKSSSNTIEKFSGGERGVSVVAVGDFVSQIGSFIFRRPAVQTDDLVAWDESGIMHCSNFRFDFPKGKVIIGFRSYKLADIDSAVRNGSKVVLMFRTRQPLEFKVESETHAARIVSILSAVERGIVYKPPKK